MNEDIITAPYNVSNLGVRSIYGERAENLIKLQEVNSWSSTGSIDIPQKALDECVERHIQKILTNQVITFDLFLTGTGYIISLFMLIFFTIEGNIYLIAIGGLFLISTIVHTTDGIVRRWKTTNLMKRIP